MAVLRMGLIGCGQIVRRRHVPCFRDLGGVVFTAAWSRRRENAGSLAHDLQLRDCRAYGSVEDLLGADVDAVVVATPSALHHRHARAALDAGKHVFLEKPMTLTVAEADDLAAAAGKAGKTLVVNQSLRFNAAYITAARAIARGLIGSLHHVDCYRAGACSPDQDGGWAPGSKWFVDPAAGGGVVYDIGVHMADLLRWFGGPVKRVQAEIATRGEHRAEDNLSALFRFQSGATGTLTLSWTQAVPENRLAAHGSRGAIRIASAGAEVSADGKSWQALPVEEAPSPHRAFMDAVQSGIVLHDTVAAGREAVALCVALHRAAGISGAVNLAPIIHEN